MTTKLEMIENRPDFGEFCDWMDEKDSAMYHLFAEHDTPEAQVWVCKVWDEWMVQRQRGGPAAPPALSSDRCIMTERERFEAWKKRKCSEGDSYAVCGLASFEREVAWKAWQAAVQSERECFRTYLVNILGASDEEADEAIDAIRQRGGGE